MSRATALFSISVLGVQSCSSTWRLQDELLIDLHTVDGCAHDPQAAGSGPFAHRDLNLIGCTGSTNVVSITHRKAAGGAEEAHHSTQVVARYDFHLTLTGQRPTGHRWKC